MVGEIVAGVSAEEIRAYARSQKEQWRKFLRHVEWRTRRCSREKVPPAKRAYLVLLFESAELDLLLDLDSGEIHEIVDGRFKWFLMNHHRGHSDVQPLLAPASDSRVCAFASYTRGMSPKYANELFKNAEVAFVEKDEDEMVRHYYYDLTKRKNNPDIVLGVIVVCKDPHPEIKQPK